ncbi:MAG TPA: protein tyrosine phosphatase family protein [Candidatus Acidoferrum sp.]|nr:protein tyrosine phosphatase family protein [Candidatus Acidoferrum sp.]
MTVNELATLKNLRRVSFTLATSGQPNERQLATIADEGFTVVINLALHDDPRYSLADETGTVTALGMQYFHIPVRFDHPTRADLDAFFRAMTATEGRKRWIHCAANYRVSAFLGLYWTLIQGQDQEQAFALLRDVWQPNATWATFIADQLQSERS